MAKPTLQQVACTRLIVLVITASIGAIALAGCASAGPGAPVAVTAAASPSCASQFNAWRTDGGGTKLVAVINDMNAAVKDSRALSLAYSGGGSYSQAEAALQSEAADVQADSQTSQDDLAPACVPRLAADQNDASKAAIDCDNVIQALNADNASLMLSDAHASAKVADAADAKFNAIAADLKAFEG